MVVVRAEEAASPGVDFLEWLGPDTSAVVFAQLCDPADIARASAVSRSWRTIVLATHFSKIQCLRVCPDVANFTRIDQVTSANDSSNNGEVAESSAATAAAWEIHERDHMVYTNLVHTLLSPCTSKNCIAGCIGASSTDNFPEESIENTLDPWDSMNLEPSYWSSVGHADPTIPEYLIYRLRSDLCLINEIRVQPFRVFFQPGHHIFSAQYVRFRLGYPKVPLQSDDLVSVENEGELTSDSNYIWTYTSPEFPMLQENVLQSFKLPRSVLCIGGVVKVELLGRVQKHQFDNLYYICVTHVQVLGSPLSSEFGAAASVSGLVLKYCPSPAHRSCSKLSGNQSKWRNFEARLWREVTGPGIGLNQELLSRLLGPSFQFLVDDDEETKDASST
ncbi:hypothetical protein EJB05_08985 [Eragrostis curvula]|uniref:F-box domain-containing protein n=1 Tax=Eragrostis curvula TaxID=38414 RepID=A0A5J9W2E9_9POAL|nr:hypothetical protein EJB05_08985 [Eragrostis curvula]